MWWKSQVSLYTYPVWQGFSFIHLWLACRLQKVFAISGRLWSDCADAQADLSLCWSHKSYCRFCHGWVICLTWWQTRRWIRCRVWCWKETWSDSCPPWYRGWCILSCYLTNSNREITYRFVTTWIRSILCKVTLFWKICVLCASENISTF